MELHIDEVDEPEVQRRGSIIGHCNCNLSVLQYMGLRSYYFAIRTWQ